ncbi:hypothetical protein K492DRAFT_195877 [Lichtheimia hyalospora FSU 10163]|nr:hypothetical protein K492DRAFT_195877 [Lichtheimia hyalospora FSU 10163]
MFMRLIILESDRHSLWIKAIGITLIAVRFADWPYELAFQNVVHDIMNQQIQAGGTCWVQWGNGVIIFNFVGDSLANLFLSGMFVRRLYLHIRMSKTVMSRQNRLIEHIARKSLICLIFTFVVNLAMNLLKITEYIGDRSDAFTVYFQLIESTLLVEALRVEGVPSSGQPVCENCGLALQSNLLEKQPNHSHHEEGKHANPLRSAGTNESIFRELSFFDASLYNEDVVLRDTNNNNNNDDNDKGHNMQPSSPTVSVLSPRPMQQPAIPPPVANPISSNNAMDRRRPLSQHPEWSNNDYRMF